MSKRQSSTQSNTLFNYFQSPKTPKSGNEVKKNSGKNETPQEASSTKRKRNNSDSDEENAIPVKPKWRIPKKNRTSDSEEDPIHKAKSIENTPKRSKSHKKTIDSDSEEEPIQKSKTIENTPKRSKSHKKTIDSDSEEEPIQKSKTIESTPKRSKSHKNTIDSDSEEEPQKQFSFKATSFEGTPKKAAPIVEDSNNWAHETFDFIQPKNIRDKNQKRPTDPDYDPRTLFVPRTFLDKQTPGMRQWWVLKSDHMDSVIFFKVGKFYELYHMDAVVGVNELGFHYMKGAFAHSGFPESAYQKMATALIEKGFKVARCEQTETPELMAERCRKQGKTTKFDKVVNREICQVTSKGTCVYSAQLPDAMHSSATYMHAICEQNITSNSRRFGVCFIDTSVGLFHLAEFNDDNHCSALLALLSENTPGLLLTEKNGLSPKLKNILNLHYKDTRNDTLARNSQFYSASTTIEKLKNANYFRDQENRLSLPESLTNIIEGYNPKDGFELTIRALGACLWYLEYSKLDIQVVSMGKFAMYQPLNFTKQQSLGKDCMVLDAMTIDHLDLFGKENSFQNTIDFCKTAFGKRLLQRWICRPLCRVKDIQERQEAIKELFQHSELLANAQEVLKQLPDLERQLAKIHIYGNRVFAQDHPDGRAVFYEAATYSKRRINDLLKTLQGFELAQKIPSIFKTCKSSLLRQLTLKKNGRYLDLSEDLQFFKEAFDQEEAKSTGNVIPRKGIDQNFDDSEAAIDHIKEDLASYLKDLESIFKCKLSYFGADKKRFQIEIPETYAKKVTSEYQLEGTKKGAKPCKRYSTPRSRELLADMLKAEDERRKIIQDLNRRIFEKFSQRRDKWEQVIDCLTKLDVLCSLAEYAHLLSSRGTCLPEIHPISDESHLVIENGRHPCIKVESYVPNSNQMGVANHPKMLIITGPNMGGKSTLMRQIAMITIMAQMGSYVPASVCKMNLVDRIFTRLGAHDDIIMGQSTFLTELSEASLILKNATTASLVLLDELGRGTSTHDGNAIATAYVKKLLEINCRTLFSTHYHSLVDHYEHRKDVQLGYMDCLVQENNSNPTKDSITFLYTMARGRCFNSYGFNVARLAALKHEVVNRGAEIAQQLEAEQKNRHLLRKLFANLDESTIKASLAMLKI